MPFPLQFVSAWQEIYGCSCPWLNVNFETAVFAVAEAGKGAVRPLYGKKNIIHSVLVGIVLAYGNTPRYNAEKREKREVRRFAELKTKLWSCGEEHCGNVAETQ